MQVVQVSFDKVKEELEELGIQCLVTKRSDNYLYNVRLVDWEKILPHLSVKGGGYAFLPETPDCDDFSKMSSAKCAFDFHLHSLEAWGNAPLSSDPNGAKGYHAYNMVRVDKKEYMIYEPNVNLDAHGKLYPLINNAGYVTDSWRV